MLTLDPFRLFRPMAPSPRQVVAVLLFAAAAVAARAGPEGGATVRGTGHLTANVSQAPDLTWHAQQGGDLAALVAVDGAANRRMYIAVGSRIDVYDVTDAERPVRIGRSATLPAPALAMRVSGRYLYAAAYRSGLHVFDITGADPERVGVLWLPGAGTVDLDVHDGVAFMGDRALGLRVVDVADPASPRLLGTVALRAEPGAAELMEIRALARHGSDLAVLATDPSVTATYRHGLVILDAGNPLALRERGRVRFDASNPMGLIWRGDHAYIGTDHGLLVAGVADPGAPSVLGMTDRPAGSQVGGPLCDAGARLFQRAVTGAETGLVEYALDDPAAPRVAAIHGGEPWGRQVAQSNRLYAVTNVSGQIGVYDLPDGGPPLRRAVIKAPAFVADAVWDGDRVWFSGAKGLHTLSAADPDRDAALLRTDWGIARLALQDSRLYVAAGRDGLRTLDVSDPAAPRELASLPLVPPAVQLRNVVVAGDRGYALAWRGRSGLPSDLWVLDLARPEGPAVVGTLPVDLGWNGMAQLAPVGHRLLISSDSGPASREIVVVDVHDAAAPREVHRMRLAEHVWTMVTGADGVVYVGTDSGLLGLEVHGGPDYIITERVRWRAGEEGAERSVRGIGWQGNRLFALLTFAPAPPVGSYDQPTDAHGHGAALRVLDVEADGRLVPRDELPLAASLNSSAAYRVLAADGFVSVAGGYMGLTLLRQGSAAPAPIYLPRLLGGG